MKHARATPGRHRAAVRPRYGRLRVLGAAALVTLVAVVGGFGLPAERSTTAASVTALDPAPTGPANAEPTDTDPSTGAASEADAAPTARRSAAAEVGDRAGVVPPRRTLGRPAAEIAATPSDARSRTALPARSGAGRRVVFSESRQRVWLVDAAGEVARTYLVSGSVYDNLDPGTYQVFSRSRHAIGIDDSGTMEFFVRFTHGDAGAAIGFHSIPVDDGRPVQSRRQLGTPLSHGCIRQKRADAVALWDFAPLGTTVVVTP